MSCGKVGLLRSRSRSQQRFKMLVKVCPDDIFWTTDHFDTKLDMVMQHHEPDCHAEYWLAVFNVKVTARAYMIKIWLFLLYLLNCWSLCNQTWFDSLNSLSWFSPAVIENAAGYFSAHILPYNHHPSICCHIYYVSLSIGLFLSSLFASSLSVQPYCHFVCIISL